jgi:ATP-dependent DNA ligase
MTLGIMRELGVERLIASSVNDACAMGLEGIDAKRRDRPYRSGGRRIGSR